MERLRKAGDGWRTRGATRARTYTPHTSNPPGETQRTAKRWGPASHRQEATHTRPTRHKGGYPRRPWSSSQASPFRRGSTHCTPDPWGDRSQPSPLHRAARPQLAPPSFLRETGAVCAHPSAETEHPSGAEAPATLEHAPPHTVGPLAHS